MSHPKRTMHEIIERGKAIYDEQLRSHVERENRGKFLVIDVETGSYEMDAEDLVACDRLNARRPDAKVYVMRVGYPTAYKMGMRHTYKFLP